MVVIDAAAGIDEAAERAVAVVGGAWGREWAREVVVGGCGGDGGYEGVDCCRVVEVGWGGEGGERVVGSVFCRGS